MEARTSQSGVEGHVGEHVCIGIVTVSDRASEGAYADEGGPAILGFLQEALRSPWTAEYRCVPDEQAVIEKTLIELTDRVGCSVVVTTGGTGPAPRDVTPEATEAVCDKMLPGFGEQMRPFPCNTFLLPFSLAKWAV